jgi:hypothetical protein
MWSCSYSQMFPRNMLSKSLGQRIPKTSNELGTETASLPIEKHPAPCTRLENYERISPNFIRKVSILKSIYIIAT